MNDHLEPPAARDFPSGRLQQRKEHLVSELNLQEGSRRRRRHRLVLVLVPAVFAFLIATGFTTYVLTRDVTHFESIGCYDKASTGANTTVVKADGRDPVAICAELWAQGVVGAGPVPDQLAACVLETGAIGVFPTSGTETCARLGMADLPASYAAEGKSFAELRDAIESHLGVPASGSSLGSPKCVGEEAARAAVRRELDAHGYTDWKIEVPDNVGFSAERPCAEASFDGKQKVVFLIPVWDETG
jgi:hypothetical protein